MSDKRISDREKHYTEDEIIRLEALKEQKIALKSQMVEIQVEINKIVHAEAGRNYYKKTYVKREPVSKVYKMFGKKSTELTDAERREYWRVLQREYRSVDNIQED